MQLLHDILEHVETARRAAYRPIAAARPCVAQHTSVLAWAAFMSIYAIVSKLALFAVQYVVMKTVGRRRYRARQMIAA